MSGIIDGGNAQGIVNAPTSPPVTKWILDTAGIQLHDQFGVTWDQSKLIPYLNLAIQEIINLKPEVNSAIKSFQLASGVRQSLDSGDFMLLDAMFNNGTVSSPNRGVTITVVPKAQIDILVPDWATWPVSNTVTYVVNDEMEPSSFYVFPPQPTVSDKNVIEILVSQYPAQIEQSNDAFPISENYTSACIDYVVARALMEENSIPNAFQKGVSYMQKFMQGLGLETNVSKTVNKGR